MPFAPSKFQVTCVSQIKPRKEKNDQSYTPPFVAFHLTLGIVVFIQSLVAILHGIGLGRAQHLNVGLTWLAGTEAIAALLFLLPPTLRLGAWSLLVIFMAAIAFHLLHGERELTPLIYGAGVILVMVHGSAFGGGGMRSKATT
jgi:hypothetical protein